METGDDITADRFSCWEAFGRKGCNIEYSCILKRKKAGEIQENEEIASLRIHFPYYRQVQLEIKKSFVTAL